MVASTHFQSSRTVHRIAIIGTHTPRQCGIATFTSDLAQALASADHSISIDVVAMSDCGTHVYPDRVRHEILDQDYDSYREAAAHINQEHYDVLSVQHEYGIFGGAAGGYLLNLVREAKMPIVTTLHTVLQNPSPSQRLVLDELLQLSERVIVMSHKAVGFLTDIHDVPEDKIDFIHHGIPFIPKSHDGNLKLRLGIDGPMILTFGLLSPDKGIEYVIEAMPAILAQVPGAMYVVVGATHPHVRASSGEVYRESLMKLARDLDVESHVIFDDRFIPIEELVDHLAAMDVYITPYLNPNQITSGTLAYAVGAGKTVISTPYWYAAELLDEGRGVLVPYRNASSLAEAVIQTQGDNQARKLMEQKAADLGRQMQWPNVAKLYIEAFTRALRGSSDRMAALIPRIVIETDEQVALSKVNVRHLKDMSDDTGLLQHATHNVPNRSEGYCVDDNARALLFTALLEDRGPLPENLSLLQGRYLSFVLDAFNPENGRFRNFMSYQREWLEATGSEDSQGRSLWALGTLVHRTANRDRANAARSLFERAASGLFDTSSPRTWAYTILGLEEYLKAHPDEGRMHDLMQTMACNLWRRAELGMCEEWPWFEDRLAYANARLPQAMIVAGRSIASPEMVAIGLDSLSWLMKLQTGPDGVFAPIGSDGFYVRGGERAMFDQQPLEAWASVSACLTAFSITADRKWTREAKRAFDWFLGHNMVGTPLYDPSSGGCRDGLHHNRANANQGAESTLSYLCALMEMQEQEVLDTVTVRVGSHEVR